MNVIITGGNRGIGLACTKQFLALNAHVYVIARDFVDFSYKEEPNVTMIEFDLSQTNQIDDLIATLPDIDVLVNNAGLMYGKGMDHYTSQMRDYLMALNLYTPVALMQAMKTKMPYGGRIVNNASVAAHTGHPDVWYGVSKAGLINATKSFALAFADQKIMVTAVSPSPVETDMQAVNSPERKAAFKERVISKRFATANEVAETIVWLSTQAPGYLNGSSIDMNDGSFMR